MDIFKLARAIKENDSLAVALLLRDFEGHMNETFLYLNDHTPLGYVIATRDTHEILLDVLVEMGADVNFGIEPHRIPLSLSVSFRRTNMAKHLIKIGADINACDEEGFTPLHRACLMGRTEIARILINGGANIYAKTAKGDMPLDCALYYKRDEIKSMLLQAGAHMSDNKGLST